MWQEVNGVDSHLRYSLLYEGYFHFPTCSHFYLLSDFYSHFDQFFGPSQEYHHLTSLLPLPLLTTSFLLKNVFPVFTALFLHLALDYSGLDCMGDDVLLKFDSISDKDFDIMSFTVFRFCEAKKLTYYDGLHNEDNKKSTDWNNEPIAKSSSLLPPKQHPHWGWGKRKVAKSHGR